MKPFILKSANVVAIAISCAALGIGIGFIQGEIVARMGAQDEQLVFAGTAGMVGGLVALFLGPILYCALRRRISFEQFCWIVALSLVTGCAAAWLLSIDPNGPGWTSMFVTPITVILLAINFARK
jgi:hypothetical protein